MKRNPKRKKKGIDNSDSSGSEYSSQLVSSVIEEVNRLMYGAPSGTMEMADTSGCVTQSTGQTPTAEQPAATLTSTPRAASQLASHLPLLELIEVQTKLKDLQKETADTNRKLDIITSKLTKLDTIEMKIESVEMSMRDLNVRVDKVEKKNSEIGNSMAFMSDKFDTGNKKKCPKCHRKYKRR